MQIAFQPSDSRLPAIDGYGNGGFTVNQTRIEGSALLLPSGAVGWPLGHFAELSTDRLAAVIAEADDIEVLLFGCGSFMMPVPASIRAFLREHGIGCDAMDTGAACRTYSILQSESRKVAAALIAV